MKGRTSRPLPAARVLETPFVKAFASRNEQDRLRLYFARRFFLGNVVWQQRGLLRGGRAGEQRRLEVHPHRLSTLPHKRRVHVLDNLPPTRSVETEPQRDLDARLQSLPDVQRGPGSADIGDRSPQGIAAAGHHHVDTRDEIVPGRPPSFFFVAHVILPTFSCVIWPWALRQGKSFVADCAWPWVSPRPWSPRLSTDLPNRGPAGGARGAWPRWPWP